MKSSKCPNCNAEITIDDENRDYGFCQYCGSKIMFDDYRSTQRIIDEAKVKQAETERIIRLKELELEEARENQKNSTRKTLIIVWMILSLIIFIICVFKWVVLDDFIDGSMMLICLGGPVICGGAYLIFKLIPEKESEKALMQRGGIKFPGSLEPFHERNYITVEKTLKSVGFRNITCVNMHDLTLGLLIRPGQVESILVDGEKIYAGGKIYMPDVSIVITYHGR